MLLEPGHVLIIVTQLVDVESVDVLDVLHQVPGVGEAKGAVAALKVRWGRLVGAYLQTMVIMLMLIM